MSLPDGGKRWQRVCCTYSLIQYKAELCSSMDSLYLTK